MPIIQEKFFSTLQKGYESLQVKCFRFPIITVMTGVASVILGVYLFTKVNIQMMPMAIRDCFAIEVYLDPNATLDQTKAVSDSLQKILRSDDRITSVTAFIGTGTPRFHATYGPKIPGENFAQMIVNTVDPKATDSVIEEYEKKYENYFPEEQMENPYKMTIVATIANGYNSYIPSRMGYTNGGYSTDTALFAPGSGERIVADYLKILNELHS